MVNKSSFLHSAHGIEALLDTMKAKFEELKEYPAYEWFIQQVVGHPVKWALLHAEYTLGELTFYVKTSVLVNPGGLDWVYTRIDADELDCLTTATHSQHVRYIHDRMKLRRTEREQSFNN
jgi:hypothetical protein